MRAGLLATARPTHRRPEADHVSVGVDDGALVLAPRRVLRLVDLDAGGPPFRCDHVCVVDPQVSAGAAVQSSVGHDTEVELDTIAVSVAVVAVGIRAGSEPQTRVMR